VERVEDDGGIRATGADFGLMVSAHVHQRSSLPPTTIRPEQIK
jgi:hypothetical protein